MEICDNTSNKDKMLIEVINLMAEKGYKGVSTKEIAAAAGVSEMTLFRHFGSKQNLLEEAVDRFYYSGEMEKLFKDKLVWDLRMDLELISRTYHEIMNRNRKLIQIIQKDGVDLPGLKERVHKHPQQLQKRLTEYFTTMQSRGKIIKEANLEAQAIAFMWLNFGAFMSKLPTDTFTASQTLQQIISANIELLARGMTP
ncbi:MAG: TetR/AcrR family transcriptional regulator [Paenibacillus sp.]|jgi:AcrR family transcriptional regulator|nr:TetR/AcrR family transcriptional regulator [Paenibacillus sp.]